MHYESEVALVQLEQFKRDRWPYVVGHVGATIAVVAVSWSMADHNALIWFAVVHHLTNWILGFTFFVPFRSGSVTKVPLSTYVGTVVCNATLSMALLFDLEAAREMDFTLAVGIVLFAGAAGSFVTLGGHPTMIRVALASILLPYAVTALILGHVAIALGVAFFFCNVVLAGVSKTSTGQEQLIAMRVGESQRAALAELAAATDPLTGLLNRRGVQRVDGMALSSGAAALYFDVNEFKAINDTFGHSVGDEVLRAVAHRLQGAVASGELVARVGGDEFLVLAFTDDVSTVEALVERLCEQVQQSVQVGAVEVANITVAVGVSYTSAPLLNLEGLLQGSDREMYRSKRLAKADEPSIAGNTEFDADLDRFAA